jgi:hypothetical protein
MLSQGLQFLWTSRGKQAVVGEKEYAMPGTPSRRTRLGKAQRDVSAALLDMESDLRQIEGMIALLVILSEASEPIEPAALAVVARAGQAAHDGLSHQWRRGLGMARTV